MNKKMLALLIITLGGVMVFFSYVFILDAKNSAISITQGSIFTGTDTYVYDFSLLIITAGYVGGIIIILYTWFFKKEKPPEAVDEYGEFKVYPK
ncbi:MAG: hypothetical protein PHW96_01670 [Candidatus Nanoarchaeia archaeon]|nr:hypothetical protein [Candidatus Nanoarchaeia archaeon]